MTVQVRDQLWFRGADRPIDGYPLESCKKVLPRNSGFVSNCGRGYIASCEIRADLLYLVSVVRVETLKNVIAIMFPDQELPVRACWFSGLLSSILIEPEYYRPDLYQYADDDSELSKPWFSILIHRGHVLLEEASDPRTGVPTGRVTDHVASIFSTEEVRFLRAIHADLTDPGIRRVYADWLEEQGNPRGAILRAELDRRMEMGSRPDPDPTRRFIRSYGLPGSKNYVDPTNEIFYWRWLADMPAAVSVDPDSLSWMEQFKLPPARRIKWYRKRS